LPDFNILVEVDGVYWHCKPGRKHPPNAEMRIKCDEHKNDIAKDLGYRIVRIWQDEVDFSWRII